MGDRGAARAGTGARDSTVVAGRYALHEPIGIGVTATVWRATDLRLDAPRAVKILHPYVARDRSSVSRFVDEARVLARIEHPHVVRVYDLLRTETGLEGGGSDGDWICVMELLRDTAAARIRRSGPVPPLLALRWTYEVVLALDAAHRLGVLHRDVRAANVLLGADECARLADFGAIRLRQRVTGVTVTGESVGDRLWIAPEQARDPSRVGPQADLYAAGMLLLFLLTGRLLPREDEPGLPLDRIPPVVLDILRVALCEDPEGRWPNARAMIGALARAQDVVASSVGEPLRAAVWLERALAQRVALGGED